MRGLRHSASAVHRVSTAAAVIERHRSRSGLRMMRDVHRIVRTYRYGVGQPFCSALFDIASNLLYRFFDVIECYSIQCIETIVPPAQLQQRLDERRFKSLANQFGRNAADRGGGMAAVARRKAWLMATAAPNHRTQGSIRSGDFSRPANSSLQLRGSENSIVISSISSRAAVSEFMRWGLVRSN
jgi:hypothetical protein